ncbi:SF1B family DNA helicase RecD2 [Massilibacterium senegalense]|uniref:SF1B family DNA helicase RecD2 n=1 Tax=Massilibacterium senegalense TaxID=1632858 RepID=UPI00078476CD|nr:ATP-dependent RecD-like DNA helicase [Massilibacterium senegalense]
MTGEELTIVGTVQHVVFFNEENYYSVIQVRLKEAIDGEKKMTVVGTLPKVLDGETYHFSGSFRVHPRYGKQFLVTRFEKEKPKTKDRIVQYLSSDLFKGIGKKTAERIVEVLGENAISKIIQNKQTLDAIPSLKGEQKENIYMTLIEYEGLEQTVQALGEYGFGLQLSMNIFNVYKQDSLRIIKENPYRLIQEVEGIGFKRADELGKAFGITEKDPERIKAGCLYLLEERCLNEGHTFLPYEEWLEAVTDLLSVNEPITRSEIDEVKLMLEEEERLIVNDDRIYLPTLYYAEVGTLNHLFRLMNQPKEEEIVQADFLKALGELEEELNIEYAPMQREAVFKGLTSPVMILTGGPGTGKTTVIKGIVELYGRLNEKSLQVSDYKKEEDFPVVLVAPTGRAAKRMSESTGLKASTIHRLLGWNGTEFEYNAEKKMNGELLIVDEFSMVDIWLANQLLQSIPSGMTVIFVGDEDQLPSVGPGQVLRDLLASQVIETIALTEIYRQAEGSSIVVLAHHIKKGQIPEDLLAKKTDRRFFPCAKQHTLSAIEQVCQGAINRGFSAKDIQVLAPMYKGPVGIHQLNTSLQQLFNPKQARTRELVFGDISYRKGDKVLQLVNNPEEQVFNGDIGEIVALFYAKETEEKLDQLVVSFDGKEVTYRRSDFSQLTHAYCTSIHKSQGSEFPIVVLPIVRDYYRMLKRNLIYTAITRAKDYLIICGEVEAFRLAVSNHQEEKRYSMLAEKLTHAFTNKIEEFPYTKE